MIMWNIVVQSSFKRKVAMALLLLIRTRRSSIMGKRTIVLKKMSMTSTKQHTVRTTTTQTTKMKTMRGNKSESLPRLLMGVVVTA